MQYKILSENQMKAIKPGEAITLTAVMAIVVAALMAVVVYRLFRATKGTVTVPGGWKFDWK